LDPRVVAVSTVLLALVFGLSFNHANVNGIINFVCTLCTISQQIYFPASLGDYMLYARCLTTRQSIQWWITS